MTAVIDIDLSAIRPTVAFPHLPENTKTIDEVGDMKIDQVVIGSLYKRAARATCEAAAEILKGRKVAKHVRAIVIPATQKIYMERDEAGVSWKRLSRRAAWYPRRPAARAWAAIWAFWQTGERAVATTNRNFVGRMGHVDSEVYLASPAVAAASAVPGKIAGPERAVRRKEQMKAQGRVHKYGDNVDTDVIIPARYLNTADHKELAAHCMEDIDKEFIKKVRPGDIIVGGFNFGCGSSREHAPIAIKESGDQLCDRQDLCHEFFTATPSTSGCRFWNARPRPTASKRATRYRIDFDSGVITNITKNRDLPGAGVP